MKTYKTQREVEADIVDGLLSVYEDVQFDCAVSTNATIIISGNVTGYSIRARELKCFNLTCPDGDIRVRKLDACNVWAHNINAGEVKAIGNIRAHNITAGNIDASDIIAHNIRADHVIYYAFCCVTKTISCISMRGSRTYGYADPVNIDGEFIVRDDDDFVHVKY